MSTTTILLGVIFILIIIIIIVYFTYYNRVFIETSIITDFGVTLESQTNPGLYLTTQSFRDNEQINRNTLFVMNTNGGQYATGAQGWIFIDKNTQKEIGAFTLGEPETDKTGVVSVRSGTSVYIRNSYTGGYVSYNQDPEIALGIVLADKVEISSASVFVVEFGSSVSIISLRASDVPVVNGQEQYLIPGGNTNSGRLATIGVSNNPNDKLWKVG